MLHGPPHIDGPSLVHGLRVRKVLLAKYEPVPMAQPGEQAGVKGDDEVDPRSEPTPMPSIQL